MTNIGKAFGDYLYIDDVVEVDNRVVKYLGHFDSPVSLIGTVVDKTNKAIPTFSVAQATTGGSSSAPQDLREINADWWQGLAVFDGSTTGKHYSLTKLDELPVGLTAKLVCLGNNGVDFHPPAGITFVGPSVAVAGTQGLTHSHELTIIKTSATEVLCRQVALV